MQQSITDLDRALGFAIPSRSARGRVVRLGPALDAVLAAHAYPPAIEALLAEALTLAALIGSTLKDPTGQLTMQTRTENGVI
ncbi:MAG: Hsp33 family molecular chaperone HslO, partial [Sphingomonas sp.]